jgi:hypothetical protein
MRFLSLSHGHARRLHRFRWRTWGVIAFCFLIRTADAALGLIG